MKLEREEKIEKIESIALPYFLSFKDKRNEEVDSNKKSHKTNPVKIAHTSKISHNRTKSDVQGGVRSLKEKFLTHIKRKNAFKKSFSKEEHRELQFEAIRENNGVVAYKNKNDENKSTNLQNNLSNPWSDQNLDPKHEEMKGDTFHQTRKTDMDCNLQNSSVVINEEIEYSKGPRLSKLQDMSKRMWTASNSKLDLRDGFFKNTFSQIGLIMTINAHLDAVRQINFSNSSLFSASEDCVVKEWRLDQNSEKSSLEHVNNFRYHEAPIFSTAMIANKHLSGDSNGKMMVLQEDSNGWHFNRFFNTGTEPIWSLDMCQRDRIIVSTTPNKVKFWDQDQLSDKKALSKLSSSATFYTESRWFDYGKCLIQTCNSAYKDSAFLLYDVQKEAEIMRVTQNVALATRFRLWKQDNLLITANDDHTVSLFDTRSFKRIQTFVAHANSISAMDASEKSHVLVTGDVKGSIRLWDLQNLRCIQELSVHRKKYDESINDIRIHPESRIVATAGADSTIRLFSLN